MTLPYPDRPLLLVDDDAQILLAFSTALRMNGWRHLVATQDPLEALALVAQQHPNLVLLDLCMPGMDGQELLTRLIEAHPDLPIIVVSGTNELAMAVRCMKLGAVDYLVKPVPEDKLLTAVRRALEVSALRTEMLAMRQQLFSGELKHPEAFADIVTVNNGMRLVLQYVEVVAPSALPVLITGETGTGKELVARAIHTLSGRTGPFVAVNAAGLDDALFADTLFGHERGAFTGAEKERAGLLQRAAGGTLFLDEIGDLSIVSQVKLLRLLQEGEYLPLGADIHKRTNARIIVATHADLAALQGAGKFRRDLYYRLQMHAVQLPPLRDRLDDLPVLIKHLAAKFCATLDRRPPAIPRELLTLLGTYHFPGNIRELEAMMADALTRHGTKALSCAVFKEYLDRHRTEPAPDALPELGTHAHDGPLPTPSPFRHLTVLPSLNDSRRLLIDEALRRAQNNQSVAARLLGISQQSLNRWLLAHE